MTSYRYLVPVVTGLLAGTASADQITMTLDSIGAHETYRLAVDGHLDWDSDAEVHYVGDITTGERLWTNQYGRDVVTYCIQLFEGATVGDTYTFDLHENLTEVPESPPYPGPMNLAQTGLLEDLYARYVDMHTGHLLDGTALTDGFSYETAASSFQLVVWEIVHESISDGSLDGAQAELSLDLGAFRADTSTHILGDEATSLIMGSLGENGWFDTRGKLIGLSNPGAQDQLMVVPLPLPAVLAGIGLAGMVVLRRKIR